MPAIEIPVAAGWSARRDDADNLIIIADDRSGGIALRLSSEAGVGDVPADQMAAAVLAQATADPFTSSESVTVDGHPGRAYRSRIKATGAGFQLVLVRLDSSHIVSISILSRADITPAQAQALAAESASVKILGAA